MKDDVQQPTAPNPGPAERDDVQSRLNRCPYCHEGVQVAESVVCRQCLTRHHASCHREATRCSSCGSADVLTQGEAQTAEPPSLVAQILLTAAAGLLVLLGITPFIVNVLVVGIVDADVSWVTLLSFGALAVVSGVGLFAINRYQTRAQRR